MPEGWPSARTYRSIENPGSKGKAAEKGADHSQYADYFVTKAYGEHPGPENFITESGSTGKKKRKKRKKW